MKKKHVKCYLFFGNVIVLVLALLCAFTLINENVRQAASKNEFESIYTKTKIDFIIPSPSDSQVEDLEGNQGIKAITPYYETSSSVSIDGNRASGTTMLLPDPDKIAYTPYCETRIIKGEKNPTQGCAIVDRLFAENNKCSIGDTVSITIRDQEYIYTISSISEDNTYFNDGSVALILNDNDVEQFKKIGITYSAAYVSADNIDLCKNYLTSEYKPMGRLKDRADFDNEDAYNQHVQNFNEADWSKEITNCNANYKELSVKYQNTQSAMFANIAIMSVLVLIACITFNAILLKRDSMRQFIKNILVKKSGTKADVKKFYKSGILLNEIVFIIAMLVLNALVLQKNNFNIVNIQMINSFIPIFISIVASAIMTAVSTNYVEKHYKIKTVKRDNKTETVVEVL